jgi:hypothetical protein
MDPSMMSVFFCVPPFPCPLLSTLPPPPARQPLRVRPKKYVCHKGGGAAEYASQKEGTALHRNKNHFNLILVVAWSAISILCVCILLSYRKYRTLQGPSQVEVLVPTLEHKL